MRLDRAGLRDHLAALHVFFLRAAQEQAHVVAGARFVEQLAEHFDIGASRLRRIADADDLDFLHFLEDAALDPTSRDGAAAFDVEHVFHRHEERLIDRALRHGDVIIHRGDERENLRFLLGIAVQRLERAAFYDRNLIAREFILREQIAHFHLHEIEQFRIVHHVDLVQEHDHRRHADLTREQDVLTRLRHRTVGCGNNENRAVHLRRARDHVFHIIGMAGAIDVRVMALLTLVFHVRSRDGDAALFLFRGGVDRIVSARLGEALLR